MRIVWDERKRLANIVKHEMDFADLTAEFFEAAVVQPAKAGRSIAVGWFAGIGTVVVHVRYGNEAISIVSMRRASARERRVL
jgi:uncharacterized protein